jgi:CBS domain-containing protein
MQIELQEISDHLYRFAPFDTLPKESVDAIARRVEVSYFKAGSDILEAGAIIQDLHYVRSGAVEIYRRNGELYNRLVEGDIFGQAGLLRSNKVRFPARALEDSLIYYIPADVFADLCAQHDAFADFVEVEGHSRLKTAVEAQGRASELIQLKCRALISRPLVWIASDASVGDAAKVMTEQSVSCVLVMSPTGLQPAEIQGIVTDRDLRTRVVAAGRNADETSASDIMTADPVAIGADDSVFEAMLMMLRRNIHHLPVVHHGHPIGLINLSDIIRYESHSSLYLVNRISNQTSVEGLKSLLRDLRGTYIRMVRDGATAHMIGSAISGIGRAFTQRLLELAEKKLGPPPVPYCFMVLGSMARDEQLLVTDQDNALVLDDSFDPVQHDAYFRALATFVSDGLAACGYSYCKGGIMATNDQWRQPLNVWRRYFDQWIEKPNPTTLLNSCIFFDLDGVFGQLELVQELKTLCARKSSAHPVFLSAMARIALDRTPPLGFFRTFVVETDGQHKRIINLKGRGTAPLTDLIRIHALACGSTAQNSFDRMDAIASSNVIPPEALKQLRYALEFLSMVRIRHQADALEQGAALNNYVEPERFSNSERRNLKEAFQVLSNGQNFLRFRYPPKGRLAS